MNNVTHNFRLIDGRYVCQAEECSYDTLNRWTAVEHFAEETTGLKEPVEVVE
jgi:hypothetical protein